MEAAAGPSSGSEEKALVLRSENSNRVAEEVPRKSCFRLEISRTRRQLITSSEVKQLDDRLRALEQDLQTLKKALFECIDERSELINEIYQKFQTIYHRLHLKAEEEPRNKCSSAVLIIKSVAKTDAQILPTPRCARHSQPKETMEVEVKLRLPDSNSHQKFSDLLSRFHLKTLIQENVFFDGANAELSSNLAVLRLRFYDLDSHCVVSLKSKPVISSGISRVEEDEEPIDVAIARASVAEPWRLLSLDSSRILKRVREEFGIGGDGLVCLGGFRNVRAVYGWKGLKLELDETHYDFGVGYEIECESSDPDRAKELLEQLLKGNGIDYSYSEVSKFAAFRSGKLP